MTRKYAYPLLILLPIAVLAIGYALRPPPEIIEKRSDEQNAILVYSEQTQSLRPIMLEFESAWKKAHELGDEGKVKQSLTKEALPALSTLVEALKAANAKSSALQEIHLPLVHEYEKVLKSLSLLCSLEDGAPTFLSAYKAVSDGIRTLLIQHVRYENQMKSHYLKHNVFAPVKTPEDGKLNPIQPDSPSPVSAGKSEKEPAPDTLNSPPSKESP